MKNKNEQSPTVVVTMTMDIKDDDDIELCDMQTYEIIEKNIFDQTKLREFDCLFISPDRRSAKKLGNSLHKQHSFKTEKPYQEGDEWITHAIKLIIFSDLKVTLKIVKEKAAAHSSELMDWMTEVDKL